MTQEGAFNPCLVNQEYSTHLACIGSPIDIGAISLKVVFCGVK